MDQQSSSSIKLRQSLIRAINAGTRGIYIDTHEYQRTITDITEALKQIRGLVVVWDCVDGVSIPEVCLYSPPPETLSDDDVVFAAEAYSLCDDPIDINMATTKINEVINSINAKPTAPMNVPNHLVTIQNMFSDIYASSKMYKDERRIQVPLVVMIMQNFHLFMEDRMVCQSLYNHIKAGNKSNRVFVVLGPNITLKGPSLILNKVIDRVERPLPNIDDFDVVARDIVTASAGKFDECLMERLFPAAVAHDIFESANGLTELDAEKAFSLTAVDPDLDFVDPKAVFSIKKNVLQYSSALTVIPPEEGSSMDELGGYDALKDFIKRSLEGALSENMSSGGILTIGVPGSGKSKLAKCAGSEVGWPLVQFTIGKVMSKYVGESENAMHDTLDAIERLSPCVLWIDEIEKAFAGSGAGQDNSGVMSRLLGSLLTWLQDKKSKTYVMATCNHLNSLPPELTRAGRFDAIYFIDTPGAAQRSLIWDIHLKKYGLPANSPRPDSDIDWTGGEIEHCCKLAKLFKSTPKEVSKHIVPICTSHAQVMYDVRKWASGKFLDANKGGIYLFDAAVDVELAAVPPVTSRKIHIGKAFKKKVD